MVLQSPGQKLIFDRFRIGLDRQRKKWSSLARFVLKLGQSAAVHLPDRTVVVSRALEEHLSFAMARKLSCT